jgi:hypothetical protein
MTAGQDCHQGIFHHPVLTEDDGGNRIFRGADLTGDLLGRADDHVLEFLDTICTNRVCASHFVLLSPRSSFKTPPIASSCHEAHAKLMRRPCIR